MGLIGKWVNMTGRRVTSPSTVVDFIIDAYANHNPSAENGISGVVFIIDGSTGSTVIPITARSLCFPNHSDHTTSPLPGVVTQSAPVWAYKTSHLASNLPPGTVTVTAYAVAGNTASYLVGSIVLYNDSDSVDRRPSTKQIYVNPVSGDDANAGTIGSKLKSLQAAVLKARKNPTTADSVMADADCGGAIIHMDDGLYSGFGNTTSYIYSQAKWHTSGNWWVEFRATGTGAIIQGVYTANKYDASYPENYFYAPGWRPEGSTGPFTGSCRVKFTNCRFQNMSCAATPGNDGTASPVIDLHIWIDGGTSYSSVPRNTNFTVLYSNGSSGQCIGISGNQGNVYATNHIKEFTEQGFYGWTRVSDCIVRRFTGLAFQSTNTRDMYILNCLADDQQAYSNPGGTSTDGYVWVADGAKLVVSIPSPGLMRVDSTESLTTGGFSSSLALTTSFGPELAYVVSANTTYGSSITGVGFKNFPSSGNNGVFALHSAGTNPNGTHYVVCFNPAAVAQQGVKTANIATTTQLFVGRIYPQQAQFNELVHPDIIQWNSDMSNTLFNCLAARNIREAQGYFIGGHRLTNCWLVNCSDGGKGILNNYASTPSASGGLTNCGFVNCTFSGPMDFTGSVNNYNNCFVDTVFYSTSAAPAHGTTSTTSYYDHCHWVVQPPTFGADAARGISFSTGIWFNDDPSISPYHFNPREDYYGLGSMYMAPPFSYEWGSPFGPTQGVWPQVGYYDWQSLTPPSSGTPGSGTATVQALTATQHAASFTRSATYGVLAATLTILGASAVIGVAAVATATPISMALSDMDCSAVVDKNVTSGVNQLRLGISGAPFVAIPDTADADVLSLSVTLLTQTVTNSSIGGVLFVPALNFAQLQATASVFTPFELDTLELYATPITQTVLIARLANHTPIAIALTSLSQTVDTVADVLPSQLRFGQPVASVKISTDAEVGSSDLGIDSHVPSYSLGVNHSLQSVSLTALQQFGSREIVANATSQRLNLAPVDVYQSNPATVVVGPIEIVFTDLTQFIHVRTRAEFFPSNVRTSILPASAAIGAIASHEIIAVRMQLLDLEDAGQANVLAGVVPVILSALPQIVTSGTSAFASVQLLAFEMHPPQVGTDATAGHIPVNIYLQAHDQYVVYSGAVIADVLNLQLTTLNQIGDASVNAGYVGPVNTVITPGEPEGLGKVTQLPTADIIFGVSRETIGKELSSAPYSGDLWRIIQLA